jgi:NAD(P)-dependent dehydrogenase (short-subunit alcohol dehydrogenase family)
MAKFSINSKLGDLMKDPQAAAVLEQYLPGISKDPQLKKGFGMSLKFIAGFPGSGFPKDKLPAINAALQDLGDREITPSEIPEKQETAPSQLPGKQGIAPLNDQKKNPLKRLDGKVVVLTGVSAGLGKQLAVCLAREGAKLAICARRVEKLMATAELCEKEGAEVLALPCDVSIYEDLVNFIDKTIERFGTVDVLINNANFEADRKLFLDQDIDMLDKALHTGVYSHWHLMKLCYPYLKGKSSSIINFCSGTYQVGLDMYASYAADKGAIRALSMVVAREWGVDGIRVNTISPIAITDTIVDKLSPEYSEWVKGMMANNALKRVGDPMGDIAPVVIFLATDESRWITGQNINADGGQSETIHV